MRKLFGIIRDFWNTMPAEKESLLMRIVVMLLMAAFLLLPGIFIVLTVIAALSLEEDGDE